MPSSDGIGKTQQQHFTLFFEENTATAEEYVGSHLVAVGQKFLGMLQLELIVMLVGLRAKANFLHFYYHLLGLHFFLALLLLVEEF